MKRWALVILALVAVGVIIGLVIGVNVTQAGRVRLLVAGCGVLALVLGFLVLWINRR